MEKVKEENRSKSEELEMLRRTMAQHSQSSPGRSESQASSQSSYHRNEVSSTTTDSYDDYVMDFSKPAGYRPPPPPSSTEPSVEERAHSTPRRRSLRPETAPEVPSSRPPIPPPPRRSPAGDGDSGKHHSSRGGVRTGNAEQDRQRSQFPDEIRRSARE